MIPIPSWRWLTAILFSTVGLYGCSLWPFPAKDHTSYATPTKRVAEIEQVAAQASGSDSAEQQQLTHILAEKIQSEPDPLVREEIVEAASRFQTPLAERILVASLNDTDPYVRQAGCRMLGRRGGVAAVAELGRVAKEDAEIEVRLAATRALGELGDPAAVPHLAQGLQDRDPAIQLTTVESLKLASGQNLGNDVGAWREWVASRGGTFAADSAVAGRPSSTPPNR